MGDGSNLITKQMKNIDGEASTSFLINANAHFWGKVGEDGQYGD